MKEQVVPRRAAVAVLCVRRTESSIVRKTNRKSNVFTVLFSETGNI